MNGCFRACKDCCVQKEYKSFIFPLYCMTRRQQPSNAASTEEEEETTHVLLQFEASAHVKNIQLPQSPNKRDQRRAKFLCPGHGPP